MSFLYPPKIFVLFIFAVDLSSVIPTPKTGILAVIMSVKIISTRQNDITWLKN